MTYPDAALAAALLEEMESNNRPPRNAVETLACARAAFDSPAVWSVEVDTTHGSVTVYRDGSMSRPRI